ncbi:MAG: sigma-70 family RNA polymerase sigma factor [Micromonosporaceae bacterium]
MSPRTAVRVPRPAPAYAEQAPVSELLARLATCQPGSPMWYAWRDALVARQLPLVRALAHRFRGRGEELDDLVQVGTLGLIKAIDRYDPRHGAQLSSFAVPTIVGEIKRHLRDRIPVVRVPRRLAERQTAVAHATNVLYQRLGRSPTVDELAGALGIAREETLETLDALRAAVPVSWQDAGPVPDDATPVEDAEDRAMLRPHLEALDPRLRRIVVLRFFAHRTQSEIAAELGISQVQVSRLLARTLVMLRERLASDGEPLLRP